MISIDKTKVAKPTRLDDDKLLKKLLKIKDEAEPGKKITNYNHNDIRVALLFLYQCGDKQHDNINDITACKCSCCEAKINRASFIERIDHFRPRDTIRTLDTLTIQKIERGESYEKKPIQVVNKAGKIHRGYFWLGYEWTNLLPNCEKCNLKKSNLFPLENETDRISDDLISEQLLVNNQFEFSRFSANDVKLQSEQPLLLNPELDIVERHLLFHGNGEVEGLTKRGKVTIAVYDLNRNDLINNRKNLIMSIYQKLIYALEDMLENKPSLQKFFNRHVKDLDQPYQEYSRLGYFIKYEFNTFITPILEQDEDLKKQIFTVENEYNNWRDNLDKERQ